MSDQEIPFSSEDWHKAVGIIASDESDAGRANAVAAALAEEREKAQAPFMAGLRVIRETASEMARVPGLEEYAVRIAMVTKDLPHEDTP